MKRFWWLTLLALVCLHAGAVEKFMLDEAARSIDYIDDNALLVQMADGAALLIHTNRKTVISYNVLDSLPDLLLAVPVPKRPNEIAFIDTDNNFGRFFIAEHNVQKAFNLAKNGRVTSLAVNPAKNEVAIGFASGLVGIVSKLSDLEYDFRFKFIAHKGRVVSVAFTENGSLLLSAGTDGKACVWETELFKKIGEFEYDGKKPLPAVFLEGSDAVLIKSAEDKLQIATAKGKKVFIRTKQDIQRFVPTRDGSYIAVYSQAGRLDFYSTKTGVLEYYVPVQAETVNDMLFSPNGKILAVLSDGKELQFFDWEAEKRKAEESRPKRTVPSLTKVDEPPAPIEPPDEKPALEAQDEVPAPEIPDTETEEPPKPAEPSKGTEPEPQDKTSEADKSSLSQKVDTIEKRLDKIEEALPAGTPKSTDTPASESTESSNAENAEYTTGNAEQDGSHALRIAPQNDAIEVGCNFYVFPYNKYYVGTLDATLGYFFYTWTAPFYFGVNGGFGVGFPNKKFPYDYYWGDKKMHSPYAVDISVSLPLGFYFTPFTNALTFKMEASPGLAMRRLWNGSTKASIHTKFHAEFKLDLDFIVQYKWISAVVGMRYDTGFKFAFLAGLKLNIGIPYGKKVRPHAEPKAAEDKGKGAQ